MRKLLFPVQLLLYMIILIGCTTSPLESKQPIDVFSVQVEKVKKDTFVETLTLGGLTKAKQDFPVMVTTPSMVEEVYVQQGQRVKQGERLLRLHHPELESQISLAQRQVTLLEQALNQTKEMDAAIVREELWKEYQEVLKKTEALVKGAQTGAVTMLDLLQTSTELLLIQSQLQTAVGLAQEEQRGQLLWQYEQAKQQLESLEQLKEGLIIKAPFSGVITMLNVAANELAIPQTPLLNLADLDQLLVQAPLNLTQLNRLKEGMPANIWFEEQGLAVQTTIHSISTGNIPGNAYAAFMLDNQEANLLPGQLVKIEVETERTEDALLVPVQAVTFKEDAAYVFTVSGDTARKKDVTLGKRNEEYYEVLSGLTEKDLVIVQGKERVIDGSKVSIQK